MGDKTRPEFEFNNLYTDFPDFDKSRLLVHIAFHYVEDRYKYLHQVLTCIFEYDFLSIDIIIDTNVVETELGLNKITKPEHVSINYDVHDDLKHPYLLTWVHRGNVYQSQNKYEYFMYIEDDIVVPSTALEYWKSDSELIYKDGYLRGFVRVEETADGLLVSTDYVESVPRNIIVNIQGKNFLPPNNPYQGFWFYSKRQLIDFISSKSWEDGNCDWEVRERASAGMIWLNPAKHRLLIPVDENKNIPEYILVHHLPNNYALSPASRFGKIPVCDLLTDKAMRKKSLFSRLARSVRRWARDLLKILQKLLAH